MKIHPSVFLNDIQKLLPENGETCFVIGVGIGGNGFDFTFRKTRIYKEGFINYVDYVDIVKYSNNRFTIRSIYYTNISDSAIIINQKNSYVRVLAVDKPDKPS